MQKPERAETMREKKRVDKDRQQKPKRYRNNTDKNLVNRKKNCLFRIILAVYWQDKMLQ